MIEEPRCCSLGFFWTNLSRKLLQAGRHAGGGGPGRQRMEWIHSDIPQDCLRSWHSLHLDLGDARELAPGLPEPHVPEWVARVADVLACQQRSGKVGDRGMRVLGQRSELPYARAVGVAVQGLALLPVVSTLRSPLSEARKRRIQ